MRSVGDIIRTRLDALGLRFQRQLAVELDVDESNLSKYIRGERAIPTESIDAWLSALRLDGAPAAEFRQLVLLGNAPAEIRELVDRLELDKAEASALVALYEERIVLLGQVVDALSAMRRARPSRSPPSGPTDPASP